MFTSHIGELAALAAALCWTVSALIMEFASKKAGALVVNLLKLCLASILLCFYAGLTRGQPLPLDATPSAWGWLSLSGLVGLVLGDFFLFRAYMTIGARIAMLVMATAPLLTALFGWLFMGETMSLLAFLGMLLTVGGIGLAVFKHHPEENRIKLSYAPAGLLYAFGGAVGQAGGLILSKYGMGNYNAASATQIRALAGIIGFALLIVLFKSGDQLKTTLRDTRLLRFIALGALIGSFMGITLSLYAVQHTTSAIASTLMATVPILIIPPTIFLFKEKITRPEILGAVIAVVGVILLFL